MSERDEALQELFLTYRYVCRYTDERTIGVLGELTPHVTTRWQEIEAFFLLVDDLTRHMEQKERERFFPGMRLLKDLQMQLLGAGVAILSTPRSKV